MAWWLCTISSKTPRNWDVCKEVGLYGIPGERNRAREVKVEDGLLIWMGGKGYLAEARVVDAPRVPKSRAEAPWGGGTLRFRWVVPFELVTELRKPLAFPFQGQTQVRTGFSKNMFLRSFTSVLDEPAGVVVAALREAAAVGGSAAETPPQSASR